MAVMVPIVVAVETKNLHPRLATRHNRLCPLLLLIQRNMLSRALCQLTQALADTLLHPKTPPSSQVTTHAAAAIHGYLQVQMYCGTRGCHKVRQVKHTHICGLVHMTGGGK